MQFTAPALHKSDREIVFEGNLRPKFTPFDWRVGKTGSDLTSKVILCPLVKLGEWGQESWSKEECGWGRAIAGGGEG